MEKGLSSASLLKRKNPHAHKNKLGTSTPPFKKPRPPLKGGTLWAWGVFQQKEPKMPGAHKIGAAISSPRIVRVGSWQNGFFADFYFWAAGFFADFVAGFFLLIFVGKRAQKNPPGKSPAKSSKMCTTKVPNTFLQRGRAKNCGRRNYRHEAFSDSTRLGRHSPEHFWRFWGLELLQQAAALVNLSPQAALEGDICLKFLKYSSHRQNYRPDFCQNRRAPDYSSNLCPPKI